MWFNALIGRSDSLTRHAFYSSSMWSGAQFVGDSPDSGYLNATW